MWQKILCGIKEIGRPQSYDSRLIQQGYIAGTHKIAWN